MTPLDWLEPVEATIGTPDGAHRVVWDQGRLRLADHPDPDADAALAALGADRCPCLDVLDAWRAAVADLSILTIGRRGREPIGISTALADSWEREAARWRARVASLRADLAAAGDAAAAARVDDAVGPLERRLRVRLGLLRLLALGPDLLDRCQAEAVAAAVGRWDDPEFRRRHRVRVRVAVERRALAAGVPAAERGDLPVSWLLEAWLREGSGGRRG